jgi:hypothetical protein
MRWSSHMQDCLGQIEAQNDDPLDKTLVQCVRIQLIADKAMKAASHDVNVDPYDSLRPPPSLFAQEMLTQLGTLKSTMVDDLSQDGKSTTSSIPTIIDQRLTQAHHSHRPNPTPRRRNLHKRTSSIRRPYRSPPPQHPPHPPPLRLHPGNQILVRHLPRHPHRRHQRHVYF